MGLGLGLGLGLGSAWRARRGSHTSRITAVVRLLAASHSLDTIDERDATSAARRCAAAKLAAVCIHAWFAHADDGTAEGCSGWPGVNALLAEAAAATALAVAVAEAEAWEALARAAEAEAAVARVRESRCLMPDCYRRK